MVKLIIPFLIVVAGIGGLIAIKMYSEGSIKEGDCIQEFNKRYMSSSQSGGSIYRIEKIKKKTYALSSYTNKSWMFLKEKKHNYFDEKATFRYEKVTCPDRIKKESGDMKTRVNNFKFGK